MNIHETTSGSVASVSASIGSVQHRGKGVYPNQKSGNLLTGKKTKTKKKKSVALNHQTNEEITTMSKTAFESYKKLMEQFSTIENKSQEEVVSDKSEVSEGVAAKVGGALALMAALWGGNEITSAKYTPLGKALATAAQNGDKDAAMHYRKLDTYFDQKQSSMLTSLSAKYLSNQNESHIMKGMQFENKTKKK